jgi:hypothetical protein
MRLRNAAKWKDLPAPNNTGKVGNEYLVWIH